jgi:hypothetical protein
MSETMDPRDSLYTSDWPVDDLRTRVRGDLNEEPSVKEWLPSSPRSSDPDPYPGYVIGETEIMADGQVGTEQLDEGPERSNPEGSVDINNRQYWDRTDPAR